jgi:hypothetical protein
MCGDQLAEALRHRFPLGIGQLGDEARRQRPVVLTWYCDKLSIDNQRPKEHINVLLVGRGIVKEGICKSVHAEPQQIETLLGSSCSSSGPLVVFLPTRLLQPAQIIGLISSHLVPSRLLPP